MIEHLTKEDIILINSKTIKRHGGNFVPPYNFLHEEPLDYLVEAVQAEMFNTPLYPSIPDKAGLYMYNIISNHIFQDGNKRTGLEAAILFIRLNKNNLKKNLSQLHLNDKSIPEKGKSSDEILLNFNLEIASSKVTLEETQKWFEQNIS